MTIKVKMLIITVVVLFSCQQREWDNPFDPDCPKDIFTPTGFKSEQQGNLVKLTWSQANTNISGYVIERSVDGGASWSSSATLSKTDLSWNDPYINGGKVHLYRIVAIAGSNRSNEVTTQVTPVFASSLTTKPLTKLLSTTAVLGGEITSDGGTPVTARGVCWSTSPNPTITNFKTSDGAGTGAFTSAIIGLSTVTTYYVRAYSTTNVGTSYGNQISFKTFFGEVTDIEGNVYPTVKIGDQIWMAENMKVTKYNDGAIIPNVTDNTQWAGLTTGAYCWYSNDINNKNTYGALYNWYSVNSGNLAPKGWRVSTQNDWVTLWNFLGGVNPAAKLKESGTSHWQSNNSEATNETGFTALPGGYRVADFAGKGSEAYWWNTSEPATTIGGVWYIVSSSYVFGSQSDLKYFGHSVRCVLGELLTPTIVTSSISSFTSNSAVCGGNITNDGGAAIIESGVCWNTTGSPTKSNNKTSNGSGKWDFTSILADLSPNTTYYVRAYAINSHGTAYGNEVIFTTALNPLTVTDLDGNVYNTLNIGSQVWMASNLKVTKFNDNTAIPLVTDNTAWSNLLTPGFCWYSNNQTTYGNTYGALYNWYTVNTGKLCPSGWHVPSDAEWTILTTHLGGNEIAGGKLKETGTLHWNSPNTGATNLSGFTAVPSGDRKDTGLFDSLNTGMCWWSTTSSNTSWARIVGLYYNQENASRFDFWKKAGFSVRCVKDL